MVSHLPFKWSVRIYFEDTDSGRCCLSLKLSKVYGACKDRMAQKSSLKPSRLEEKG
jgi:acyl-CoA thioesterase FadM